MCCVVGASMEPAGYHPPPGEQAPLTHPVEVEHALGWLVMCSASACIDPHNPAGMWRARCVLNSFAPAVAATRLPPTSCSCGSAADGGRCCACTASAWQRGRQPRRGSRRRGCRRARHPPGRGADAAREQNSCELLGEMLGPIRAGGDTAGLQEAFVMDLVDQCYRYKSMLAEVIPSLTEEELVVGALAANDDLARVLHEYDTLARGRRRAHQQQHQQQGVLAAGLSSSSGGGAASSQAVPSSFTLLGDDEEEGEDLSLATRRGAGAPSAASPAAATPAAPEKGSSATAAALQSSSWQRRWMSCCCQGSRRQQSSSEGLRLACKTACREALLKCSCLARRGAKLLQYCSLSCFAGRTAVQACCTLLLQWLVVRASLLAQLSEVRAGCPCI
ncbi:hypothetical protein COO60DRAFT_521612 [Scenedesmus sp. NREL 46B-D3]|nr:hypothetical protein COO60DRAFT_521612 [Scenedesmus sp. NREL 46B-D3]